MHRHRYSPSLLTLLHCVLAGVLFVSVPFSHALEIHHIFAEVDHDGHEHSDSDLCNWVKQHTSCSLSIEHISTNSALQVDGERFTFSGQFHPSPLILIDGSRAPPRS